VAGEVNGWGKILVVVTGAVAVMGGPSILLFTDLRTASKEHQDEIAAAKERQVADHSFQTVAAVQQWCDAVIRELERENSNHREYFEQQCPSVVPPVAIYHPPAPPWGTQAISGK
jgi:hypothetical protein